MALRLVLALRRRLILPLHLRRRLKLPLDLHLLLIAPDLVLSASCARARYGTFGLLSLAVYSIVTSIATAPAPLALGRKHRRRRKNTK